MPAASADCGRERELERIIPGRNDADDAERLRHQPVARGQELQRGGDSPQRHPALQVLCGMPDLGEQRHRLGDGGLDCRAVAEIGRDRLPEALLVVGDEAAQPRQPVQPLGKAGRRLVPRPHDHGVESLLQRPQRGARQGFIHGVPPSRARFSPYLVAARWPFVELLARARGNAVEIGPSGCHKVEKNVPAALSKGSPP